MGAIQEEYKEVSYGDDLLIRYTCQVSKTNRGNSYYFYYYYQHKIKVIQHHSPGAIDGMEGTLSRLLIYTP